MYIFPGLWSDEEDKAWLKESRDNVVKTMQDAEKKQKPHWKEMLEEVYHDMPPRLQYVNYLFYYAFAISYYSSHIVKVPATLLR